MQFPVQHMMLILLLYKWRICTAADEFAADELAAPKIAKKNCASHCGDVSIPYPFGVGPNNHCYFDEWYEIECKISVNGSVPLAKPFLRRVQLEVLSISTDNATLQVMSPITYFNCKGKQSLPVNNLTGSPFAYSSTNSFVAVCCGLFASLRSGPNHTIVAGCTSSCESDRDTSDSCESGMNCCRTTLSPYLTDFSAVIQEYERRGNNATADCEDYAFLVDKQWFDNNKSNFRAIKGKDVVPVVIDWSLSLEQNKSLIKLFEGLTSDKDRISGRSPNDSTPFCFRYNATSIYNQTWYQCFCPPGFEGNPYLLEPCQDIDECKVSNPCMDLDLSITTTWHISNPKCNNTVGGHICFSNKTEETCEWFAIKEDPMCYESYDHSTPDSWLKAILPCVGLGIGLLSLISGACWVPWVYNVVKKWKNIKRREMFYKRNGGLLLEQQLSSGKVNVEKIKLFKSKELERSTDNFNADRIIGQGGQGTVYKGMLMDGRIVAVKKSKIVDKAKLSEFINEVVILSQINHRNILQLLGCCLETEVPLLVYEFIPNGNLSQYIHEQTEEFPLTWEIRLRIATEIAGAISYLHASALFPIYHRDIKSTNILLDEKYRAKIADFGTSRFVAIDQTHLTTNVHGTFGYLDPEYYRSSHFTDKSDVYSFGVVLVELLTGKKPVIRSTEDEMYKNLAAYFIDSLQEDSVFDILDARVMNEDSKDDIMAVANLAKRCLHLNGRDRPTMREVTAELMAIQLSEKTAGAQQSCEVVEFGQHDRIEQWDDVVSSSTMSTWEGGTTSSSVELPQVSMKTC